MQPCRIAMPDVAEEIRPNVGQREKLIAEIRYLLSRPKEFLIHLCVVESGHGPAIQPERTGGKNQVRTLEARIAAGGCIGKLGRFFEHIFEAWSLRKELRQSIVEANVETDDSRHGGRQHLLYIGRNQRGNEPLFGLRGPQK